MQQLHPPSAWDNDLLSLYSLEFHQERAASFSSQQQFAGTLSTFMIIEMEKARKKTSFFEQEYLFFRNHLFLSRWIRSSSSEDGDLSVNIVMDHGIWVWTDDGCIIHI